MTVMNLTIQHGRANLAYGHGVGGGIANFGTLTLRNVIVRDNFAANDGSGIYNQGVLTLAGRTSIRDNRGITGITSVGYSWWSGLSTAAEGRSPSITMDDASSVSGHKHSGVFVEGGTLTMNDSSSIFGNKATAGGGVNVYYGRLVMNDASSIHDNRANETGGGVFGGTLTMNDASSIHDNRAVAADGTLGQGGGVWIYSGDESRRRHLWPRRKRPRQHARRLLLRVTVRGEARPASADRVTPRPLATAAPAPPGSVLPAAAGCARPPRC